MLEVRVGSCRHYKYVHAVSIQEERFINRGTRNVTNSLPPYGSNFRKHFKKGSYVSFSDKANDAYSLNIHFFSLKDMKSQQLLSV